MVKSQVVCSLLRTTSVVGLLLWACLGTSKLRAGPIQWTVAEGGNGDWYDLVMPDSPQYNFTWTQARAAADSMAWDGLQGYLATVTSPEEGEFLRDNFRVNSSIFMAPESTRSTPGSVFSRRRRSQDFNGLLGSR